MGKSRKRCVANREGLMWRVEVQFEVVIQAGFEQGRFFDEDHVAAFRSAHDGMREMDALMEVGAYGMVLSTEKEEHRHIYLRRQRPEILPVFVHEEHMFAVV